MEQGSETAELGIDAADIEAFLEALRRIDGFRIGAREQIAVTRLLAEFFAQNAVHHVRDLKPYLAPIVARSVDERERFSKAFDRHFLPEPLVQPDKPHEPARQPPSWRRHWRTLAALAAVLAVTTVVAFLVIQPSPEKPAGTIPSPTVPGPEVAKSTPTPFPAPSTEQEPGLTKDIDRQTVEDVVHEIIRAASHFSSAPTLEELSQGLAPVIGWPPEGLTIRLHKVTGLPRSQPLPLLGFSDSSQPTVIDPIPPDEVTVPEPTPSDRPETLPSTDRFPPKPVVAIEQHGGEPLLKLLSVHLMALASPSSLADETVLAEVVRDNINRTSRGAAYHFAIEWVGPRPPNADWSEAEWLAAARQFETSVGVVPEAELHRALLLWSLRSDNIVPRLEAPWQPQPRSDILTTAPSWTPAAASSALVLLTIYWLSLSAERRKAYLRRRQPDTNFAIHELVADQIKEATGRKLVLNRAAQDLQLWGVRETDRLDVERTVNATLLSGRLTPVRARARSQPAYLVLIEAASAADQQATRMRELVRALEERMLNVEVYYFASSPAWCHPEAPWLKAGAPFARPPVAIDELTSRFHEHRLIVLATGERFRETAVGAWAPSVLQFTRWTARAMLTPTALRDWSEREFSIAQELQLPLGRATEEGLLALSGLLSLNEESGELFSGVGDGEAQALPSIFKLNSAEWIVETPPDEYRWDDLRRALVSYLDRGAYYWLCACAIYPGVRWDLTLFLGVTLTDERGAKLYREDRLSALTALPWFRQGRMPDWLRKRLINEVAQEAVSIRAVLRELVERSRIQHAPDPGNAVTLRIATPERGEVSEALDDEIFLDFLAKGEVTDFEVPWLDALKRLIPQGASSWIDRTGVAIAGLGLVFAGLAFAVAPRGGRVGVWDTSNLSDGALPSGAWAPLAMCLVAFVAALSIADHAPLRRNVAWLSPPVMLFGLVNALFGAAALALAIAVDGLLTLKPDDTLLWCAAGLALAVAMIAITVARAIRAWLLHQRVAWESSGPALVDLVIKATGVTALWILAYVGAEAKPLGLGSVTLEMLLLSTTWLTVSATALVMERACAR
jgi:hypothetical protein